MRRCFHCILIGKIDKLKPATPVATLRFLLAGHHQLARACLSAAIIALFGPLQALIHCGLVLLASRNLHKRRKKENPTTRIKVIISFIFFSVRDACDEPRPSTSVRGCTLSATRHRDLRLISKTLIGNPCNALRLTRVLWRGVRLLFRSLKNELSPILVTSLSVRRRRLSSMSSVIEDGARR